MKKLTRSMAIVFAVVCVLMIMAVPAFAASGNGWYMTGSATEYSDPITVRVVVQGRCNLTYSPDPVGSTYINTVQEVTLGQANTSGQTFTVRDAIIGFNSAQNTIEAYNISGDPISSSDYRVYGFGFSGYTYEPIFKSNHGEGDILCDGWMFRVNGKIPTTTNPNPLSTDHYGADISQTPIADGDIIYFYWDYPWKESGTLMNSKFVTANGSYSGGILSVNLKVSDDWYADAVDDYEWTINSFTPYKPSFNTAVYIYDESGNLETSLTISKNTSSASKMVSLSSGTYYISVPSTRATKTLSGVDWYNNAISCTCLKSTGAYEKFTV